MGEVGQQSFHAVSQEELTTSQQLNICPFDFTLLVKWVNNFQSTQDCTAENLKNWHCMKEH